MKHICDNCGKKWDLGELAYAQNLHLRVDPGGVMPSGECRNCEALCYPAKNRAKKIYLGIITGDYGSVIFANQTKKGLENALYEFVKEWWEESEMGPMPKEKQEAIDCYFEAKMDSQGEYLDYCDRIPLGP